MQPRISHACPLPLVAIALAAGCSADLQIPDGAEIRCDEDSQCPEGLVCAAAVHRCMPDVRDDLGPRLLAASATDAVTVRLSFDEPLAPNTALVAESYVITPTLGVVRAELDDARQSVDLTVAPQRAGDPYTVQVSGVTDARGNPVGPSSAADFVGFGTPPDRTAPDPLAPAQDAVVRLGGVLFAWTARSGAQSYTLEIALDAAFTQPIDGSPMVTSGTTAVAAVAAGAWTYYWRVRADVTSGDPTVMSFEAIDGAVRVHCAPSDDCALAAGILESGNGSHPYRSIARALAAAVEQRSGEVRVASRGAGSPYHEALTVPSGIDLSGGWTSDFSAPAAVEPTALVHDSRAPITVGLTDALTTVRDLYVRTDGEAPALHVIGASGLLSIEDCTFEADAASPASTVVSFESTGGVGFTRNTVSGGPSAAAVRLSGSYASLTDNDIDASGVAAGYGRYAVEVRFGGSARIVANRLRAADAEDVRAVSISDGGHAVVQDNTLVAQGSGTFAYGLFVGHTGAGWIERNLIFALGGSGTESYALGTWLPYGTTVASNVLYAAGGYSVAANLLLSDGYLQLIGNTLLVASGGTAVYLNDSQPVLVNNIMASAGAALGSLGVREAGNARPAGFLNNLLFNLERPYVVVGTDTDPASLDDPSGAQTTWARFAGNTVAASGALSLADVFIDLDGPDEDAATWLDNDYRLALATDPLAIATSGLNVSSVSSLPECYWYNVSGSFCSLVDSDLGGAPRTPPLSIGAYEKD